MGRDETDVVSSHTDPRSLRPRTRCGGGNLVAGDTDPQPSGLPRRSAPRNDNREEARNDKCENDPGNDKCENDPVRFASDTLGVTLWSRQEEVLRAVERERRVAVVNLQGL